jgi:hypothetical protein
MRSVELGNLPFAQSGGQLLFHLAMMLLAWLVTATATKAPKTASGSARRITKNISSKRTKMTMIT